MVALKHLTPERWRAAWEGSRNAVVALKLGLGKPGRMAVDPKQERRGGIETGSVGPSP